MSDFDENIEYIESYFRNQLSDAEKKHFEERCLTDNQFAGQVALFIKVEEGIRQKILQEKRKEWPTGEGSRGTTESTGPGILFLKWLPYAAAASLVFAFVAFFLFRQDTPRRLADKYIEEHFTLLSQTMNASKDSLQQGIAAYNNKDYKTALQYFQKLYHAHPGNSNAKKNAGLVYLVTKDYDKALQEFDELASMADVYRNPGAFLKAITLLKRNRPGDEENARQLLENIVNENSEGSRDAKFLLDKW